MRSPDYLRTDTLEDAISSLELAVVFYDRGQSDERYWKWFVLAIHSGVQGCFALALASSHGLLVQKPGVASRMLAAIEARSEIPSPHMDNFLRLYSKLQLEGNLRSPDYLPLPKSDDHEAGLSSLDELRDEFLHFNTKSWSCEFALIERAARAGVEVARFLLFDSKAVRMYDDHAVQRAELAVRSLAQRLQVAA
jgi:hypothetical protein